MPTASSDRQLARQLEELAAIHESLRGTGSVWFGTAPLLDLAPLAPISPSAGDEAYVVEDSFLEGFGRIELDYLAEGRR